MDDADESGQEPRSFRFFDFNCYEKVAWKFGGSSCHWIPDGECVKNVHALDDLAEYCMVSVEPGRFGKGDKELAAVGAWTCVCHGQKTGAIELEAGDDFILELVAWTAGTGSAGISALGHEVLQHSVEAESERVVGRYNPSAGEKRRTCGVCC